MRHLFRQIGDGSWEDIGDEALKGLGSHISEEEIVACAEALGPLRGPKVRFEVREVPDDTEGTSSENSGTL